MCFSPASAQFPRFPYPQRDKRCAGFKQFGAFCVQIGQYIFRKILLQRLAGDIQEGVSVNKRKHPLDYNPLMRKIFLFLIAGITILALLFIGFFANREKHYPEATIPLLNAAETQWYNAGITHYRLAVEVEFSTERRRHAIIVQNGQITEATLSYWDGRTWSEPILMGLEQAALYTVPGLFNTLRDELNQALRKDLRVDMNTDPAYPRYMYLGPVWQDSEPMNESEARISVAEFELLPLP
jgi:hypothetical protein